ncbi:30S ribosomal protein S13 [Candidatus Woesearchaeota archaeon]|nr:30S ribosomal protein S13 [Candidatus Woesearchaeota archaeon]
MAEHKEHKDVKAPAPVAAPVQKAPAPELRHLVRILNNDVKGEKHVLYALTKIKGVSVMFANAVLKKAGIPTTKKAGYLNEKEVAMIENLVQKPRNAGIPLWMLNRRKDVETGEDLHLITSTLDFTQEMDLKRLKKTKSYKGFRHQWGQPVRGQKTKSNFRVNKGKGSLGVKKKAPAGRK